MRVKVYDVDNDSGKETLVSTCDHVECFPDDDGEALIALNYLTRDGRYWCGGGAAPLVVLRRVED